MVKYKYVGNGKHYIPRLKTTISKYGTIIETDIKINHPLFLEIKDIENKKKSKRRKK